MKENATHQKLEKDLNGILNPITPSNEFIEDLHNRLRSKSEIIVEYPDYLIPIIFIFSGLCIGIMIIWFLGKIYRLLSGKK